MLRLSRAQRSVEEWRELETKTKDLAELASLLSQEQDRSLQAEIESEVDRISALLDEREFQLSLGGEHDARNAILTVHAGAGGTESQDWAEMLLRMYLRWAERRGYASEILDSSPGEEAGIKSATIDISGDYAYGYLKSEHGVHRLVRLSPFDADHARHTSFAQIEVMPEAQPDVDIQIGPDEVKVETFRSSGPGGQHMQKTSSAVRLTHLPTGTTVVCQNERSQYQNKEAAMKILRARLLKLKLAEDAEKQAQLKGERVSAGWGNQIRSYILHPYRMIKDHRTGYQTANTEAVLAGELEGFINVYLRTQMGKSK